MPGQRSLVGRGDDLGFILAFADQAAVSGGALLLSGEAGWARPPCWTRRPRTPGRAGSRLLRAAGAEFERTVSFAGLNQLLHPLLDAGSGQGLSVT